MGAAGENALYVGNDMYRDIFGARGGHADGDVRFRSGPQNPPDCSPDHTITDFRDLLTILDCPWIS